MKTKILSLLLTFCIVLSTVLLIAGCAQKGGTPTPGAPNNDPPSTSAPEVTSVPEAAPALWEAGKCSIRR